MTAARVTLAGGLALLALSAAALLLLVAPNPSAGEPPQEQSGAAQSGTELTEEALRRLASGELEAAAEQIAASRGLIPAGDSCGMRRPNLLPPLSRVARERLVAAHIAPSPAVKLGILEAVARQEPKAAWRARAHESEIARRIGDLSRAQAAAEAALAEAPGPTCAADAHFLLALASEGEERMQALRAAVALDPGFYDAWETLVVALIGRLGGTAADCDADGALVIEAVVHLDKLARTDLQLARLEILAGDGGGPARALLLGMVRERVDRATDAGTSYAEGLAGLSRSACAAPLRRIFETRLIALRETKGNR